MARSTGVDCLKERKEEFVVAEVDSLRVVSGIH